MSVSVVEDRYRLRAHDLVDGAVEATIVNVTVEGLETLRPLLHFDRVHKPLALDPGTANDLARVTGSAIFEDWIGETVKLAPDDGPSGLQVAILAPNSPAPVTAQPSHHVQEQRRQRARSLMVIFVVVLIFLAVYLMENAGLDLSALQELLTGN